MERTVSTSNQPQHLVVTTVWDWRSARRFSRIISRSGRFSEASSSPESTRHTPARHCTLPDRLPDQSIGRYLFSHSQPELQRIARQNGNGVKASTGPNYNATSGTGPIPPVPSSSQYRQHHHRSYGPFITQSLQPTNDAAQYGDVPSYTFGNSPRTAPWNLYVRQLPARPAMVRSFPLHITESSKLNFRAECITSLTTPCSVLPARPSATRASDRSHPVRSPTASSTVLGTYRVLS